jgi:hypothetical protein
MIGSFNRCALALCAVIIIGGCEGVQGLIDAPATAKQVVNSLTTRPSSVNKLPSLAGEMFTATDVHETCHQYSSNDLQLNFRISGMASGPLAGTFRAYGSAVYYVERGYRQIFLETFRIDYGARRIFGHAETSSSFSAGCHPDVFNVTANFRQRHVERDNGTTGVTLSKHSFSQSFQ